MSALAILLICWFSTVEAFACNTRAHGCICLALGRKRTSAYWLCSLPGTQMKAPNPEHIRFTAQSFFDAYRALDTDMNFGPPKVVCLALADELIIKAILALEGTDHGRAHSIKALFEKLASSTQLAILERVQAPKDEFLRKIGEQETSGAFVLWRYIHEVPEGQVGTTWTGCLNQLYGAAVQVFEELLGYRTS